MFEQTPPKKDDIPKDDRPDEAQGKTEVTGPYYINDKPHISGIEFAGPITFNNKTNKAENVSDDSLPGNPNITL